MEIRNELMGFETLDYARKFNNEYSELLDKVPVGEWVRCKDIDEDHYHKVAKLFIALCEAHYAQRREVDDGIIEYEDEVWVSDTNGEPRMIDAFDKDGNFIGQINNPRYRWSGGGHYEKVTRKVHASHAEYIYFGEKREEPKENYGRDTVGGLMIRKMIEAYERNQGR